MSVCTNCSISELVILDSWNGTRANFLCKHTLQISSSIRDTFIPSIRPWFIKYFSSFIFRCSNFSWSFCRIFLGFRYTRNFACAIDDVYIYYLLVSLEKHFHCLNLRSSYHLFRILLCTRCQLSWPLKVDSSFGTNSVSCSTAITLSFTFNLTMPAPRIWVGSVVARFSVSLLSSSIFSNADWSRHMYEETPESRHQEFPGFVMVKAACFACADASSHAHALSRRIWIPFLPFRGDLNALCNVS